MVEIQLHRQLSRGLFFQQSRFTLSITITESPGTSNYADFFFRITGACAALPQLNSQLQGVLTTGAGDRFELRGLRGRQVTEELLALEGEIFDIPALIPSDISTLTSRAFSLRALTSFDRFEGRSDIIHRLRLELPRSIDSLKDALLLVPGRFKRLSLGLEGFKTRRFGSMLGLAPVVSEISYFDFEPSKTTVYIEADFFENLSSINSWAWLAKISSRDRQLSRAFAEISSQLSAGRDPHLNWSGVIA